MGRAGVSLFFTAKGDTMGKHLQIRVMAQTWNPEAVCKAWPMLCATAEPASKTEAGSKALSDVLALVQALQDSLEFGPWSKAYVKALEPGVQRAVSLKKQLEDALADWNPTQANTLSDRLEDELNSLEREAAKAPDSPLPYRP